MINSPAFISGTHRNCRAPGSPRIPEPHVLPRRRRGIGGGAAAAERYDHHVARRPALTLHLLHRVPAAAYTCVCTLLLCLHDSHSCSKAALVLALFGGVGGRERDFLAGVHDVADPAEALAEAAAGPDQRVVCFHAGTQAGAEGGITTSGGRVLAVNSIFINCSNQLGAVESGWTAAWLGAVPSVWLGGVATIVIAGACAVLSPSLRRWRQD